MAKCEYCKNELQKGQPCACCGARHLTAAATFIYGLTRNEFCRSEVALTDRYLIVRKVSPMEGVGIVAASYGFGLVGALLAALVSSFKKRYYAFYDLKEIQKVIYPYYTDKIKKEIALKFINMDGSSFVLIVDALSAKKIANAFAEKLLSLGVYVENGSAYANTVYCEKPFVNKDTFGARICASAAPFIQLQKNQFAAPPISTGIYAPQQQTPANPFVNQPIQQPIRQTPNVTYSASQDIQATKTCLNCGYSASQTAKFCQKCGKPLN